MDAPPPVTRTLEIELVCRSDPIRGTIGAPGERPEPFNGWIELAATLEDAISARPPA